MNALARIAVGTLVGFSLLACGGATTQAPKQPGEAVAQVATEPAAAPARATEADKPAPESAPLPPAPALSTVAAPGELVFHLRWQDPDDSVAALASFTSLPSALTSTLTRKVAREFVKDVLRRQAVDVAAFADLVLTDAPIDVAIFMVSSRPNAMPKPAVAFSVGLSSVVRAREAIQGETREISDGLWQIGEDVKWGQQCGIAAALGRAPARLVCGDRRRDFLALAPYMARNLGELPDQTSDLRVNLSFRRLLDKHGRKWANQARGLPVFAQELKIGEPTYDDTLMDAAAALALEAGHLIHDVDRAALELDISRSKGLSVSLEGLFAGKRSWLVQTLVDGAHLASPAPAIFWQLPKESSSLSYGFAGDPQRWAGILDTLRVLLEGRLKKEKIFSATDARSITTLLRSTVDKHAPVVSASGGTSLGKNVGGTLSGLFQNIGWAIYGVESSAGPIRKQLKEFVKVYNRPTVQARIKGLIGKQGGKDALKHLPVLRMVRAPSNLGPGAVAVRITVPQVPDILLERPEVTKGMKTKDLVFHMLLMADGSRTWSGFGTDAKKVARVLASVKGSTPGAGSIDGSPRVARLRQEKHNMASLVQFDVVLSAIKGALETAAQKQGGSGGPPFDKIIALFDQLPHGGKAPMYAFVDLVDGKEPKAKLELNLPRQALDDIGFVVSKIGMMVMRHRAGRRPAP